MPHRGKNRRFSTLSCIKTGGTQPKLSAARLPLKRHIQRGLPDLAWIKAGGAGLLRPLDGAVVLAGDAVPRLDADKAHGLLRRGPDQRIWEILDVHADAAARVALKHADRLGFEVHHAVTVAREQLGAQRDAGDVAAQIVIWRRADQAVRRGVQAQRGLHRVKENIIVCVGVPVVKRQGEAGVEAQPEAQGFAARVAHADGVADAAAFEHEGRAQGEVIRPDCAGFVAGGQLKGQLARGLAQQGMLHIAGETVLFALVDLAVRRLEMAARQLARVGEENRRMAVPHGGIGAPDHFAAGSQVDGADHFRAEGIDGQADELVFNRVTHNNPLRYRI